MSNWTPRKWKPIHLQVARLYFQGYNNVEIAAATGLNFQYISQIINGPDFTTMLQELTERTLDTVIDVQQDAQAIAPRIFEEKVSLALSAKDERVRNTACSDILEIAGHRPVTRMVVERAPSVRDELSDKTEEEIRLKILEDLGIGQQLPPPEALH